MFASAHAFVPDQPLEPAQLLGHEPRAAVRETGLAASGAPGSCELELITTRAGFEALETEWNGLHQRAFGSCQLFLGYNWLWHWANHFMPADGGHRSGPRYAIVTGRRAGRIVMIWPLITERVAGITKLTFMGDPVSQYGDALVEAVEDREALLKEGFLFAVRSSRADVVRFRRVRADAAIAPLMRAVGAVVTQRLEAPYLDLGKAPTFAAYEARYSSQSRRNRRRQMRRLEERGPVSFETFASCREAADLARLAMCMKRAWLKDRGRVSPAVADERMSAFFEYALAGASHPVDCTASVLRSNGEAAAIEIAVRSGKRVAIHVIVYSLKFEKCGAGALLMEHRIAASHADGISTFDLLAPGDEYKTYWADGSVAIEDWALPLTVAGHTYVRLYLGFLRQGLKSMIERMPMVMRRAMAGGLLMVASAAQMLRFSPPGT